ncbi:MAG TPA: hypothetical protein VGK96_24960 [Candidatus Sulfotelmatobacter sp.]
MLRGLRAHDEKAGTTYADFRNEVLANFTAPAMHLSDLDLFRVCGAPGQADIPRIPSP